MSFLIFNTEQEATTVRDLRAKAEGFPYEGSLRSADWVAEIAPGTRFYLEFPPLWDEDYLPTKGGEEILSPAEVAEMQGYLESLQEELPPDWTPDTPIGGDG